jgi:Gas vesicle synthesis protein GvpO
MTSRDSAGKRVRAMGHNSREPSQKVPDTDQPSIRVREAAQLALTYATAVIDRQPTQITAVEPTDKGDWIVEAEVIEDRRFPSTADMLALYEIELAADGDLLAYRRTRRYMRGQRLSPEQDQGAEQTIGDINGGGLQ